MTSNTQSTLSVSSPNLELQQEQDGSLFPLVKLCQSPDASIEDAARWVQANKDELLRQATESGTVFFRDFPVVSAEDFDTFLSALSIPNFPYRESLSNAVRFNRTDRVFTANEAPSEVDILYHHEMAQTPVYPGVILFFCEKAADEGGATQLCRSDWLYERLLKQVPEFIKTCEQKGLKYTSVMPEIDDPKSGMGRSWGSTLGVDSKEAAEHRFEELGYSIRWLDDGSLRATTPALPAVMEVSPGRRTFFNQLIAAFGGWKDSRNDPSDAIRHGDGSKLDAEAVQRAIGISEEISFEVPWQAGDVALIDNTIVMHGRRPFVGTRKVLASLSQKRNNAFVTL